MGPSHERRTGGDKKGKDRRKERRRDRQTAGSEGKGDERERGREREVVRILLCPWVVGKPAPGRRGVGRTRHGPQVRSLLLLPPESRRARAERTPRPGRCPPATPASAPAHLLAGHRGLRRAAVRTAGPGARAGLPEVSEHALGWLLGGSASAARVLSHPLLAESFLFMNEKFSG